MKHKVIQTNKLNLLKKLAQLSESVLHHGEKNNSSNPFSYQENPSRQRAQRFKTLVSGSKQPWRSSTFLNKYIISQKRIRLVGSLSLILLLALTAFTLRPVSVSTDSAEATANPATTTLTVATSGNAAILDITPSSTSGTFSSSDTSGTSLGFSVTTNNITGYNLGISHASSTTPAPLVNEDLPSGSATNDSNSLSSLPAGTSITDSTFNTSTYKGYYGYKPSKLNSQSNSNYIPAPTKTSTTLNKTTRANTTSDNYTIALGANIDYTKPAGTYTNTFILTAVANNVAYIINYLDNTGTDGTTGTDVSNLPTAESASTATASGFTLSSTAPTRANYSFIGWCDGTVTHDSTGTDTCAGSTYQAGSTYTFSTPSATSTNVANLYAMWKMERYTITFKTSDASSINFNGTNYANNQTVTIAAGTYQIYGNYGTKYAFKTWAKSGSGWFGNSAYQLTTFTVSGNATITLTGQSVTTTMQDLSVSSCTTTPKPVYDARDNEVYWIQKLADGNCWMLDNLRLGGTSATSLTAANTNSNGDYTLPASGTTCFYTTTADCDSSGDSTHTGYTVAAINTASKNKVNTDIANNWGYGSGKYGVYYNFCAATMNSYCYAAGSGTGDASQDVCPKGWRMPTGGPDGEYQALYTAYSSNPTSFRKALSTPLSGEFFSSSAIYQGSRGYFWSFTHYNGNNMYDLRVYSYNVSPQDHISRYNGFSVRCVLKDRTISDITYMQDVTPAILANTAEGATATLIDNRDNQSYLVGKLADGKLWMLDNLRLGSADFASGVTELNSTNTNTTNSIATSTFTGWNTTNGFNSYTAPMINTASANTINSDSSKNWGSGSHKYGVYYNYCAATMKSYCKEIETTPVYGSVSQDVCPKGWRMPTGSTSGEYQALCSAVKGSDCDFSDSDASALKLREVLSTPLSGRFDTSSASDQGSYGRFWSSTHYVRGSMYDLGVGSSTVNPRDGNARYYGFSVRCVLK